MSDRIQIEIAEGAVFDLPFAGENLTLDQREKLARAAFEHLLGLWREALEQPEVAA